MSPSAERRMSVVPVRTMFAATASAMTGSSHCQPVTATPPTPTSTPITSRHPTSSDARWPRARSIRGGARRQEESVRRRIDHRRDRRDDEPCPELLERLHVQQPLYGGRRDGERRNEDHAALEGAQRNLRFLVSVRVVFVRRARRDVERDQRARRRHQVDSDSIASDSSPTGP